MLRLKDLGEFGLIRRYVPLFAQEIPQDVEGIGNDCAVIPFKDRKSLLVTTDLLVENTHFIKGQISAEDLGYKSLSVNISDIAAMGGKPLYAFLSVALPVETPLDWVDRYIDSFRTYANQCGILLLGGDTTRSSLITINVLLIGEIESALVKRRSQAIPGDIICCTGILGDSGAGLKILLEKFPQIGECKPLLDAHFRPKAQLEEGQWLAQQQGVHAMMDVSDGLASDICRIMEQSNCGAHITVESLPVSESLRKTAAQFDWDPLNMAVIGGEDYCLLLTVDPESFDSLQESYSRQFNRPLNPIGTILSESRLIYTFENQTFIPIGTGFDHFKS
jgi:thiamine-monophosphate kinase